MRFLIIRLSSLGDIILTEPVTALIKQQYPDAVIDYITKPLYQDIVKLFPYVSNVYTDYENSKFLTSISKVPYDYAIDLHNKLNSRLILNKINAKDKRVYKKQRLLRSKIVKKQTDESIDSTLSLYLSALTGIIKSPTPLAPWLSTPKATIPFEIKEDKLKIGIFPGASYETKRWPSEHFKKAIELLDSNFDTDFYIMGSESESGLTSKITRYFGENCIDLGGKLNFSELAKAISSMDLLITNDSGPMHLASAYNKPLVAIFGATHPRLGFKPMNNKAVVLAKDYPCQPCSLHGGNKCPLKHYKCMQDITPQEVFELCKEMITRSL